MKFSSRDRRLEEFVNSKAQSRKDKIRAQRGAPAFATALADAEQAARSPSAREGGPRERGGESGGRLGGGDFCFVRRAFFCRGGWRLVSLRPKRLSALRFLLRSDGMLGFSSNSLSRPSEAEEALQPAAGAGAIFPKKTAALGPVLRGSAHRRPGAAHGPPVPISALPPSTRLL